MISLINFKQKGLFAGILWGIIAPIFCETSNLPLRYILGLPAILGESTHNLWTVVPSGAVGVALGAAAGFVCGCILNNISYEIIISRLEI